MNILSLRARYLFSATVTQRDSAATQILSASGSQAAGLSPQPHTVQTECIQLSTAALPVPPATAAAANEKQTG